MPQPECGCRSGTKDGREWVKMCPPCQVVSDARHAEFVADMQERTKELWAEDLL